ncbi:MAG: hypothetical protein LBV67_07355 [Streptococcaceae bacterium]|jgi:hypothetical protein|nr:hypothetical protein [Streptococcaceae bacterium]
MVEIVAIIVAVVALTLTVGIIILPILKSLLIKNKVSDFEENKYEKIIEQNQTNAQKDKKWNPKQANDPWIKTMNVFLKEAEKKKKKK